MAKGIGRRRAVLAAIAAAGLWAAFELDLDPRQLDPGVGGLAIAREFLGSALTPAVTYEAESVPAGASPFLLKVLVACRTTVIFAAAAISLALVVGLGLGFLASSAWWTDDAASGSRRRYQRFGRPLVWSVARVSIALMRSVHELLWAVLFLAAFGLNHVAAVIAIAIPYAGTLAKVFSEMLDEAPREAAHALRSAGASPLQVLLFGLLPRALPDMSAYAFYRFECALRSSAVLGFFGYPTLGYFLAASFENLHYREVWTYLYALIALAIALDLWSGALRRRWVAA
jgi:phosphonate transport system permease protein